MQLKGINVSLFIGPAVPIPAPKVVTDALTGIQVTAGRDRTGFQLTFAVSKSSPIITTMLPAGYFDPISTRVVIVVTIRGIPQSILDGVVTRQELAPSNDPGQSTLTITGEDLSVLMDVVETTRLYPNMPDIAKVYAALAPYALFGVAPVAIPPILSIVQVLTQRIEAQVAMTDLAYIKMLASRCGYVFFVQPGPVPFSSIAYFGPDVNVPVPQSALSINMDASSNVESLSFSLDGLAKKVKIFQVMDPITKKIPIPIPVPNINAFKPPLGARPTPPAKVQFENSGARQRPDEAAQSILAFLMNNSAAISASGSLDVVRYGRLLQPHLLVGVRGAGLAYDGLYYVDSITHNIKRGEYKQSFNLSRDGLISITPRVIP